LPHHYPVKSDKGERSGVAKKLEELAYTAPARPPFLLLVYVTAYLYFVLMSIMPGRIYSMLSFCIYPLVCSSEEFKKYFATPLRSPLPAYSGYYGASLPLLEVLYR
jgi:hypothetical protein